MRGVNLAIIVGNLGADPETRYSGSGTAITSIRVATSEQWKDKQTGESQERTEWHRIKAFGRLAEIMGEYLRKGSQVYIQGSIRTEKYTDKDGVERYSTEIVASELQMLGSKSEGGERPSNRRQAPQRQQQREPESAGGRGGFDSDDIPFRQHMHRMY